MYFEVLSSSQQEWGAQWYWGQNDIKSLTMATWLPVSCASLKLGNLLAREGILDSLPSPWNYLDLKTPEIRRPNLKLSRSPTSLATDNCQDANLNNLPPFQTKLQFHSTEIQMFLAPEIRYRWNCTLGRNQFWWKERNRWWKKLCSLSQVQIRGSRDCGPVPWINSPNLWHCGWN